MEQDPWRAWARFRDEFEGERARLFALLETARAALSAVDAPPLESVRETLAAAEDELARMDLLLTQLHAHMMALRTLAQAVLAAVTMN